MSTPHRKRGGLTLLHLIALVAIGIWWGLHLWRTSPARAVFRKAGSETPRSASLMVELDRPMAEAARAFRLFGGDVLFGLGTLLAFGLGTHVYVRRAEIWLGARSSNEALSFGASDLASEALAANEERLAGPGGPPKEARR